MCPVDCPEKRWIRGGALLTAECVGVDNYPIGNPVRFLLVDPSWSVNRQFCRCLHGQISVYGDPAKIVSKARECLTGRSGFEFVRIGLQHPLHCLIPHRVLQVQN